MVHVNNNVKISNSASTVLCSHDKLKEKNYSE